MNSGDKTLTHTSTVYQTLRELSVLAIPIVMTNFAMVAMQAIDTLFIGQLGSQELAGFALASAYIAVLLSAGVGLMTGLDYFIASTIAKKETRVAHEYLYQGFYLAIFGSAVLILAAHLLQSTLFWVGAEGGVASSASSYLGIISWSLLPMLFYLTIRSYLQAHGIVTAVVLIVVVSDLLKLAGNYALVFGHWGFPKMGIQGAAVSTLVARSMMFFSAGAYLVWIENQRKINLFASSMAYSRKKFSALAWMGLPGAADSVLDLGSCSIATVLVARIGADSLSAHQIALQIESIAFMLPMGISASAALLIAKRFASGAHAEASRLGWIAVTLTLTLMVIFFSGYWIWSDQLFGMFTQAGPVQNICMTLLVFLGLYQAFDAVQMVLSGALRGTGDSKIAFYANLLGYWVVGLTLTLVLCFVFKMGLSGVWIGMCGGAGAVSLSLLVAFWKRTRNWGRMIDSMKLEEIKIVLEQEGIH